MSLGSGDWYSVVTWWNSAVFEHRVEVELDIR